MVRHAGGLKGKKRRKKRSCSSKSRIIFRISGIAWISCQAMVAMRRELLLRPSAVQEKKLAPRSPSQSSAMVCAMADFTVPEPYIQRMRRSMAFGRSSAHALIFAVIASRVFDSIWVARIVLRSYERHQVRYASAKSSVLVSSKIFIHLERRGST
jgi:hypothetical protein